MKLRKEVERNTLVGEEERRLDEDEIKEIHCGFYLGTTKIVRVELIPCPHPEINSSYSVDRQPMQMRVVRKTIFGKERTTNSPEFSTDYDQEHLARLNEEKALNRASHNERIAQVIKIGLVGMAIGIALGAIQARKAYKLHKN